MTYQGFPTPSLKSLSDRVRRTAPASLGLSVTALLLWSAGSSTFSPIAIAAPPAAPTIVAQTPRTATILYVNPAAGRDEAGAGLSPNNSFRTITYALKQAQAGTVIQLAPGSYTAETGEVFPIVVPAGVIVRGNETDKGQTIVIIGGGNFISKTFARQTAAMLASTGSEIRGVSVTNPNVRGTGIWVESSNPVIENSTFANNNREGIFITGTANPTISKNIFSQNGGNGISAANNARGEIKENVFQNTGFGIAVSENAAPSVTSNRFTENTDGLYLNDTAKPILRNNIIENSKRDGIVATGAAAPDLGKTDSLGNNIIRNNRQFDLNNSTSNVIVSIGNAIDSKRISGRVEFSGPTPDGGVAGAFPDVQGHWAQAYIEALAQRNIITGFPGGAFRPNDPVTRVQYAAIISKAFNPAPKQAAMQFSDINSGFWGFQPIQTVVRGGFMRGYPEGVFRPDQQIPRVQVLVALATGLGFPAANDMNVLSVYQDGAQIPAYARNAVAAATMRKIVVNYPELRQFNPNREATRAEVAALVYQALVAAGQAPALPSPYVVSPN